MKSWTTRDQIREIAQRWARQYPPGHKFGADKDGVAQRLAALDGESATAADVEAIVGNASWVGLKCDDCGAKVEAIIQLGEEPDCESATANVCDDCIRKACELAEHRRLGRL